MQKEKTRERAIFPRCVSEAAWGPPGPGWTVPQIDREEPFEKEVQPKTKLEGKKEHGEGRTHRCVCVGDEEWERQPPKKIKCMRPIAANS